jgi:5,5'-dehydrodivanillate O-demethylase oxygenase subunit
MTEATRDKLDLSAICHVGPGTAGGEMFRRYWLAVSRGEDLKDIPQSVKVLGEELVLFRDGSGGLGLMGLHCSHRGTSLEYGDIEERGIRCPYHGWLYDTEGNCLDQPLEPKGSTFCQKVKHPAYRVKELGGLIFAYMGPHISDPPPIPRYSALVRDDGVRLVLPPRHWDYNWFNFFENTIDSLHAFFLHKPSRADRSWENAFWDYPGDHHIEAMRTDYGLKTIVHWPGPTPDTLYVRLTTLALPTVFSLGGRGVEEEGFERLLFVTPVDDDNFMVYSSDFVPRSKEDVIKKRDQSRYAPPAAEPVKEYDKRKYVPYRGQVWKEDYVCQSTQGKIGYRHEQLGTSDRGVILLRKLLMEAIETVQKGGEPQGIIPKEQEHELITLDAFRRILPKSAVAELLRPI